MKFKVVYFVLLGLFFVVSTCFAKDYDVSVSINPKSVTVNPCGIATFDIDIKNFGEMEDTYSITITGLPDGWYSLSENSIDLKSGESSKVYLFVTPYCYGETGTFKVFVTVSDGASASDTFTLEVIPDHKIEVSMPEEIKTCLGETSSVNVTIKNEGNFTEDVELTLSETASDFAELSENKITLEPFEEKTVELNLKPTPDIETGDYQLELNAKSTSSYANSKSISLVKVLECYKVETSYLKKIETCLKEETIFELTITNAGLKKDSYTVEIEDMNYTKIVELEAGDSTTLTIPFVKDEEGTYDVSFKVTSDYVSKEESVEFDVLKCYGVELSPEESSLNIDVGRGKLTKVQVTNLGTKEDTFDVMTDIDWASVKPEVITLTSGEKQDVYVYYSPNFGMSGTYETTLTAKSEHSQADANIEIIVSGVATTTETTVFIPSGENTTTSTEIPSIPTGGFLQSIQNMLENKIIRALLIAVIVVIIILIIVYLVIMR